MNVIVSGRIRLCTYCLKSKCNGGTTPLTTWLYPHAYRRQYLRRLSSSSSCSRPLRIRQVRVQDAAKHKHRVATVYESNDLQTCWASVTTTTLDEPSDDSSSNSEDVLTALQDNVITYFLPARYPDSVTPGYARFAGCCFCASVAGSAAMVLSTQTLLLAVGVVGSKETATVMAGALNWVLKDGIGQLGGVWFASRMSQAGSAKFDADPKKWRMVAALSLDAATLLEIMSPLVPSVWVLPIASVANVGKNIGFLTASASRAALHQSLAIRGNLADVTAKSGSQSMAAGLIGTSLGIGLSPILGDLQYYALGFVCLSAIHQGCNYLGLKAVPLFNLNRRRLNIIMDAYAVENNDEILSPSQVAEKEDFMPFVSKDESKKWLSIGTPLPEFCPGGPAELDPLLDLLQNENYLINLVDKRVHLVFHQEDTSGQDLIQGMFHAHLLHGRFGNVEPPVDAVFQSYQVVQQQMSSLLEGMHQQGWKTATEFTTIESSKARRYDVLLRD